MKKRPDKLKPTTAEQVQALTAQHGSVERGVEPEEVGITPKMMREAQVESGRPKLNGPQKLEALRAVIGGTTDEQAHASMAAYEAENSGKWTDYGEDPTDWERYQREQKLKQLEQREVPPEKAGTPQKTNLDALRAFIVPSTAAQAREREAADAHEKYPGFGEDPTPLDAFLREREELAFLEQRDASVTDAQLIERMNAAPDMGGSIIAEHLAQETDVPAELLRTLAGTSDPKNEHQFTAEAARTAFAGVKVLRRVTKPKTVAEAVKAAVRRYGTAGRENVSSDDASGQSPSRRKPRGVDVRSLKPTPPMTEAEKAARFKSGRIAEMTEHQAGLWLLPPNPGPFGTLEQWQAWRQELLALGHETAGVDVELQIADEVIASMQCGHT